MISNKIILNVYAMYVLLLFDELKSNQLQIFILLLYPVILSIILVKYYSKTSITRYNTSI